MYILNVDAFHGTHGTGKNNAPMCGKSKFMVFYNDNTYEVKSNLLYCLFFVHMIHIAFIHNSHTFLKVTFLWETLSIKALK